MSGHFHVLKDCIAAPVKLIKLPCCHVSFNYIGKWNEASPDELFQQQAKAGLTVQFTLGLNRFQGNETIQLMVEKLQAGQI